MAKGTIPISAFKARCLAVLRRVKQTGQTIIVTKFGEPIAEIVPAPPTPSVAQESRRLTLPYRCTAALFVASSARVHDVALVTADAWLTAAKPCKVLANR